MTSLLHFSRQPFSDASAQESALLGWSQFYGQLRPGRFAGQVETLSLPGIRITRERVNLAVAQQIASPIGTAVFVSSLEAETNWRINATVRGTDIVSLYRGGTEVTAVAPDNSDVLIIVVEAPRLGAAPDAIPPVRHAPGSPQTKATKQWLASLLAIYADDAAPPELDAVLPGLVLDRMQELFQHFMQIGTAPALRPRAAYALYRRALQLVGDRDQGPLSVADLANQLGVPATSLREALMETIGLTTGTWLRQHRLDGARRDLARAAGTDMTVSEIAMKWGFWHLGRFSAYYAQRYGHMPSDLLRVRSR
jgi:AraC family ethanolamine operon transcriptional activator